MNDIITAINGHDFVSVEFMNGHEHTVKAYGVVCGSPCEGEYEGQLNYISYVENNERTEVYDVLVADNEKDAIEIGILEDVEIIK